MSEPTQKYRDKDMVNAITKKINQSNLSDKEKAEIMALLKQSYEQTVDLTMLHDPFNKINRKAVLSKFK